MLMHPEGDRKPEGGSGKALSLQVKETDGHTSAVVVADVPFEYEAFFLSGPDRLVLDLKGIAKELPAVRNQFKNS